MTPSSKRIQQQATAWAVKAHLGALTAEESAELQKWLDKSSRHLGAYVRANAIQANVERITALGGGTTPDLAKSRPFLATLLAQTRSSSRLILATATAIALFAVLGTAIYVYINQGDRYVSGIGELRQVALTDGSTMLLNTATQAVVKLKPEVRDIELTQGEALFEVAHDRKRPFLVHAGDLTVKAVGTAFSVRVLPARSAVPGRRDDVEVLVTEGTVELSRADGTPPTRLSANHRATIRHAEVPHVETIDRRETERELTWRTGRLEFDGQTLIDAVREINRHNRRQIEVTDPRLAERPIVGSFRAIDSEAFASIAAATLNARVVEDGATIRIEPKE